MSFIELGLNENVLKALEELNFETPTPIQEKVIPTFFQTEQDIIGLAQTGTGKTAAFGLPLVELINANNNTQAIILCPTRELCVQIHIELKKYAKYIENLKISAVYGGANIVPQIKELERGVQIVVGTPGRVIDLIKRKKLILNEIKYLILDEADEMLNMGFKEDLDTILETVPDNRRTLLFSATMPNQIARIAKDYMKSPTKISVGKENSGADNLNHSYYMVAARDKFLALKRIIDIHPKIYGIVFCRTRNETREISAKLMEEGYNADALHGDLSQAQRDYVMLRFRQKYLQILVATDVAARGLDVNDLTHIIHFNLPDDNEIYIHRSGRTGRAGKAGESVAIIHTREKGKLFDIERNIKRKFEKKKVPTGNEICEKQLFNLIDKVEHIEVDETRIQKFLDPIYSKLEYLDKETIVKKFVSIEFNRFLSYYKNAKDINIVEKSRKDRNDRKERRSDGGRHSDVGNFKRFFINVGLRDKLTAAKMIGLIKDYSKRREIKVGKIDIMRNFSFFEVDAKHEKAIISGFKNSYFEKIQLSVEVAAEKETKRKPRTRTRKKRF